MKPSDNLKHPAYLKPLIAILKEINISSVVNTVRFNNLLLRRDLDESWDQLRKFAKEFDNRTSKVLMVVPEFSYSELYSKNAFEYLLFYLSINNSNLRKGPLVVKHEYAQRVLFTALELRLPDLENDQILQVQEELQTLYNLDVQDDDFVIQYNFGDESRISLKRFLKKSVKQHLLKKKKISPRVMGQRKAVPTRVRAKLQKEIDSHCPFCVSEDVEHFQVHHIDENPANNDFPNLLLLCPTCHSKITKGDISRGEVEQAKRQQKASRQIECASIAIDKNACSWDNFENLPNSFLQIKSDRSPFPILSFSLINHTAKTILMKEIHLKAKHLFSGFSGIPSPRVLTPIVKYKIELPGDNETNVFDLVDEIEVAAGQAFKFQVELFSRGISVNYPIDGRKVLNFTFKFNNNVSVAAPTVCLNCKSEDERMVIRLLG